MSKFEIFLKNDLILYKISNQNAIINPLNLSTKEIKIFDLLKNIIKENKLENIELWIVGGWVRDHLLNIPSNDIDILIKGFSPITFSELIKKFLNKEHFFTANSNLKTQDGTIVNLTKTQIYDTMVDFVELFTDINEDVKRRDFTFNSIYYNILENKIEDVLGKGINDLKNGIIRKNQLFIKESIHILRMLRFASNFQFIIDDECLIEIEKNINIIQNNFINKIPKERIHKEIYKILISFNPSFVVYSLYKFDLLETILKLDLNKNEIKLINKKVYFKCCEYIYYW